MKRKKIRPVRAWAGIVEGRFHCTQELRGERQLFAVYTSPVSAGQCYEHFEEVEIRRVPKKRKARRSKKP